MAAEALDIPGDPLRLDMLVKECRTSNFGNAFWRELIGSGEARSRAEMLGAEVYMLLVSCAVCKTSHVYL